MRYAILLLSTLVLTLPLQGASDEYFNLRASIEQRVSRLESMAKDIYQLASYGRGRQEERINRISKVIAEQEEIWNSLIPARNDLEGLFHRSVYDIRDKKRTNKRFTSLELEKQVSDFTSSHRLWRSQINRRIAMAYSGDPDNPDRGVVSQAR